MIDQNVITPGRFRGGATLAGIAALTLLAVSAHGLLARSTALELARLSAERESQTQTREHDAQLRLQLVGRALEPTSSVEDQQRVLCFLHAVSVDPAFKQWAEAELASLQQDVDALREAREATSVATPGARADETHAASKTD